MYPHFSRTVRPLGSAQGAGLLRRHRALPAALAIALTLLLAVAPTLEVPAAADEHHDVVAGGLANPRHVAVGPGDRLYVAEAGRGGDTLVEVQMADGRGPICVGATGAITEIRRGQQRRMAPSPSWTGADENDECPSDGSFALGAHGVAAPGRGTLAYTIGLAADPGLRPAISAAFEPASRFATVGRQLPNGRAKPLADLGAFEADTDPDGTLDTNPYGIALADDGSRLIADAGGNSLVRVRPNGDTSLVARFAPNCVAWELGFPNPIPDAANPCGTSAQFPAQAVPTGVAIGPDGDYYVSELRGFPFTPGTSRIWRVDADQPEVATCSTFAGVPKQACAIYADGFTSVVDVDFGPDGRLYAVQIADAGVFAFEVEGEDAGSVRVVPPGGGPPTSAITGLTAPGGVAIHGTDLYVTNRSVSPDHGQLLRTATPEP